MSSDLKNSTLFVAGAAVTATLGLAIAIYKEVLLPTHTLSLQNQVSALTAENKTYKEKIDPLETKNKSLKEQVDLLQAKVRELETTNVFLAGNPYPIGLSAIRIGQPASDVDKLFPSGSIKKDEQTYWSVKLDHSVFSQATYYFSGEKKIIYQASFWLKREARTSSEQDINLLVAKLTQALGPPAINPRPNYYLWNLSEKTRVYVTNSPSFLINQEPTPPGSWPRT